MADCHTIKWFQNVYETASETGDFEIYASTIHKCVVGATYEQKNEIQALI